MVSFYGLLVLFVTYKPAASTTTPGQSLTREEPRIFYGLTRDEFHAIRLEYRGSSNRHSAGNDTQHDPLTRRRISVRVPVKGEERNTAEQQAVLELCAVKCTQDGPLYRPTRGYCVGKEKRWTCRNHTRPWWLPKDKRLQCKGADIKCETIDVWNFQGENFPLPRCVKRHPIKAPQVEEETDAVTEFEGIAELPDDIQQDEIVPDGEVYSPGTRDYFYEMQSWRAGVTGHFSFLGHWKSGKEFRSQSPPDASSWTCLACPPGTLEVTTAGQIAQFVGFSLAAGSWT